MEPITMTVGALLASPKVVKAIHDFATSGATTLGKSAGSAGFKSLVHRLQPSAREKAAGQALKLFAEAWDREVVDTTPFTSALPGYREQLEDLIVAAAPEISEWMDPEIKDVDLAPIERIWSGIQTAELPQDFDWTQVAKNYTRAIKKEFRDNADIRGAYDTALQERIAEAAEKNLAVAERLAGPAPGFNLAGYRTYLVEKKCNTLQLATLHFSTYTVDRKVSLWNVFVPQLARLSAPVVGIPPEILRHLQEEGYLAQPDDESQAADLLQRYRSSPLRPVLEILDPQRTQDRHVVVTGDPGAGKSALLKYLALKWADELADPVPILIDLKEYGKKQEGFLKFCQSGLTMPPFDANELDKHLKAGKASLLLDGLDEIFAPAARFAVIEEISTISAQYPQAQIVVTSRKVGYQPERLANAGFVHATLEDFDLQRINQFLQQWHQIAEEDDNRRRQLSDRLSRAIAESASIRELAGNPLLLTMMAILNRSQELPRNRVTLYLKASEVLLHDWDADRALQSTEPFYPDDKKKLLRDLAGEMQQAKGGLAGNLIERKRLVDRFNQSLTQLGIPDGHTKAHALVQQLEERNFILASAGANRFSFVHRTFLEYYCADWFTERLTHKEGTELYLSFEQLRDQVFGLHWKDEKWHEVLRLIVGMVHETKAGELIQFLIDQDGSSDNLANLILAAGCLFEVRTRRAIQSVDDALWAKLTEEAVYFDPSGETSYVYQTVGKQDVRFAALRWIALVWRNDKAGEWLQHAALNASTEVVQWGALEEFARGWKDEPQMLDWLQAVANDESSKNIGNKAVQEIARGWSDAIEIYPWLKAMAIQAPNHNARRAAIVLLAESWNGNPEVLTLLQDRIRNDDSWYVRSESMLQFIFNWNQEIDKLPTVLDALANEKDEYVRRQFAESVWFTWSGDANVVQLFKEMAKTDDSLIIRNFIVKSLRESLPEDPEVLTLKTEPEEEMPTSLPEPDLPAPDLPPPPPTNP